MNKGSTIKTVGAEGAVYKQRLERPHSLADPLNVPTYSNTQVSEKEPVQAMCVPFLLLQ